jgi:hypothetical protein
LKYKRAELTTQQIVLLIILLVSFAVLLFFIYQLNFQELSEKQICQNSIQVKSKTSFFSEIDCKTNYICISGGDSCSNFNAKTSIKIDLSAKDGGKEQIMKVIADEMADCWWMFGEGKLDYVGGIDTPGYRCAICSTIEFDEKIQEKYPEIVFSSEVQIDTSEKYLIITGMDPKLPLLGQQYFYPKLVKSSEINLMNPSCKEFITKA